MTITSSRKLSAPQSDIEYANQILESNNGNKSATIRTLFSENWTRSRIALSLNIRYQHVRNVLITPVKKS
jgi:hypothetical protein